MAYWESEASEGEEEKESIGCEETLREKVESKKRWKRPRRRGYIELNGGTGRIMENVLAVWEGEDQGARTGVLMGYSHAGAAINAK